MARRPCQGPGPRKEDRKRYFATPFIRMMGLDLELRGRRRDGTQFPVDIAFTHVDTEDGLLAIAAVRYHGPAGQRRVAATPTGWRQLSSILTMPSSAATQPGQVEVADVHDLHSLHTLNNTNRLRSGQRIGTRLRRQGRWQ